MGQHRFIQLDVFSNQPFAGNPLAVFPEAEEISDEDMLKIAREMNLSETVFVLPARDDKTLRRLRIFTPTREIPFAGHPIGAKNAPTAVSQEDKIESAYRFLLADLMPVHRSAR